MKAYQEFAEVYDIFMRDIPYEKWAEYVLGRLEFYGVGPMKARPGGEEERTGILELGCGTGNMSRCLCKAGYRVVGIDLSADMVRIANRKNIPGMEAYVADMRRPFFSKGEKCGCVVSLCDSMNYLTGNADMELTMKAAAAQLVLGGIFLFDLKTDAFYRETLGDRTFSDSRRSVQYIWENHYDEERHLNFYDITFYRRKFGGLYRRFKERHIQRAYSRGLIERMAKKQGLELMECKLRGEREYYVFKRIFKEIPIR